MVAEVDQSADPAARMGAWESSGILNVSEIFGKGTWLVTVQAHTLYVESELRTITDPTQDPPVTAPELFKREGGQLLLDRLWQEVVAGDDCHQHTDEVWTRSDEPEELQAAGDGHPEVQDDSVGQDVVGQLEPGLGRECRRHREPLELENPREGVGDRSVVVHDQDGPRGGLGRRMLGGRNHGFILWADGVKVKQTRVPRRGRSLYKTNEKCL